MRKQNVLLSLAVLAAMAGPALADNEIVLNEANCVSGDDKWLKSGAADSGLIGVRVEGNGQNWIELIVTAAGPSGMEQANGELDLRNYKLVWEYDKDLNDPNDDDEGAGYIQFKNIAAWQHVKVGTLITISEGKEVWYGSGTDKPRNGWKDGYGATHGSLTGTKIDLVTNLNINYTTDWAIHLWAGDTAGQSGAVKAGSGGSATATSDYFIFNGYNADGQIGVDNSAGLFVANNDNWAFRILNAGGTAITPWVGEAETGYPAGDAVGSDEVLKLEAVANGAPNYLTYDYQANYANSLMHDGKESTMGKENKWSSGTFTQALDSIR